MNTTHAHSPAPDATTPYRPASTDARPAAELVAGSAPLSEQELVPLLHRRLRFLVILSIVFYAVIGVLMRVLYPRLRGSTPDNWTNAGTLVVCIGLLALLSSRRHLTLRQLRVVEFVLFAL